MGKLSRKELKKINFLELTPVRIHAHQYRNSGLIDVLVPRFKSAFFSSLIPKTRSRYINANLDELGSAVWELIDGNKNVNQISDILEERFNEKISPVHERLTMFLQQLNTNNFIYFKELTEK